MGGIVALPRRHLVQPQYAVPLDKSGPFAGRLKFAYSVGRGSNDGAHGLGSITGTMAYGTGPRGRNVQPADSSSYISFPDNPDYNIVGGVTCFALVTVGGTTVQQHILSKSSGGGGSDTPWAFGLETGGYIFLNRANGGFRVWQSGTAVSTGQTVVIAATQGADISAAPKFYVDGVLDSVASSSLYGGSGSGAPNSNTSPVRIGNRADLASQWFGLLYDGGVLNSELSGAEIAELSRNVYSIWQPTSRKIWVASSASSSGAGSSAGLATASGVGASTAASVGSSSGLAAASGIGASIAAAVGSSAGVSSASGVGSSSTGSSGSSSGISAASGVGASTAASVGSSSGIASASAVGDSSAPGSTVGSAFGVSGASGVGASIAAAVGSSGGVSSASGVPLSAGQQSSGGYGGIYVSREDRAERRKRQRIELGIIKEEKAPAPALEQFEISNLSNKKPISPPASNRVDLAQQEALNAELKRLIAIDIEQEEQEILRILMSL